MREILGMTSKSETITYQRTSDYYRRPRIISINTFKILFYLTKREGSAYFSDIKTYLNRSSSQVSQIMRILKFKNYVKADNCRPLKYTITELGRKVNRRTIHGFLKYKEIINNNIENKDDRKASFSYKNTDIEREMINFTELEQYYKDILISFFIELPEILVDLNVNFTPKKYQIFVEDTKAFLLKYDIVL